MYLVWFLPPLLISVNNKYNFSILNTFCLSFFKSQICIQQKIHSLFRNLLVTEDTSKKDRTANIMWGTTREIPIQKICCVQLMHGSDQLVILLMGVAH